MAAGIDITASTRLAKPTAWAVPINPKFSEVIAPVYKVGRVRQIPNNTRPTDQPDTVSSSVTALRALSSKWSVKLLKPEATILQGKMHASLCKPWPKALNRLLSASKLKLF